MIPLEDNFNDVIGKAQRGLGFGDEHLASSAGISVDDLAKIQAGDFDEAAVRKLAPVLKLGSDALLALGKKTWRPQPTGEIPGLAMFNTPYADMTVNSYLAWDPDSRAAVAFDTGADASEMLDAIKKNGLKVELILLTHTHGDHIADLERLKKSTGAEAWICEMEAIDGARTFAAGREFKAGKLRLETRQTSGHSRGGITFVVHGLNRPIAVAGDSIFAGSMGGGMVSYADALGNNREKILTLPDETIICPGHGPMTTVGEEKKHNPFFTG